MGCGSSSTQKDPYPRQAYPGQGGTRQGYQNYQNYGPAPTDRRTAPNNHGDRLAEGAIAGAALGYGMYHMAHGGGMGMGMPIGQDLPMGYHLGPQIPEHNVEVMGVDVI